jgi:hypothetical protein
MGPIRTADASNGDAPRRAVQVLAGELHQALEVALPELLYRGPIAGAQPAEPTRDGAFGGHERRASGEACGAETWPPLESRGRTPAKDFAAGNWDVIFSFVLSPAASFRAFPW